MNRRRILILGAVLVAVGVGASGAAFRQAPKAVAPVAPTAVPVVASSVLKHDVPIYLRGVGTVIAYNNVIVRSQITGQLVKVAFTQGQAVHQGDLLVVGFQGLPRVELDRGGHGAAPSSGWVVCNTC